jgi:hypothetical protein
MSPIVGTYTNAALNAKLVITFADDSNGAIKGTFSQAGDSWNISGNWNNSTISPNAVFYFGGSTLQPTVFVAGAGAATTTSFADTTISISIAQKGGVVSALEGRFVRSN